MFEYIKRNPLIFILIFLAIVAPQFVVGSIRIILYLIFGVIMLLIIAGVVLRFRIERMQRQMRDRMNQEGTNSRQGGDFFSSWYSSRTGSSADTKQQGDIKIIVDQKNKEKKVSKSVGDYVDFEEVDKR